MIDLSYPIHTRMFKYPTDPEVDIEFKPAEYVPAPYIYDESGTCLGQSIFEGKYKSGHTILKIRSHHGTHIDAPVHKLKRCHPDGRYISEYPLERFVNSCILIDLTSTDLMQRQRRALTEKDLNPFLDGDFSGITALILYTGYCDEMRERDRRLTGQEKVDFEKRFPYLTKKAAQRIIDSIKTLRLIGIDSFSFDPQGSNSEVHRLFFSRDILLLETLFNLRELKEKVKDSPVKLHSTPLNYHLGDAAQVRAYAEIACK